MVKTTTVTTLDLFFRPTWSRSFTLLIFSTKINYQVLVLNFYLSLLSFNEFFSETVDKNVKFYNLSHSLLATMFLLTQRLETIKSFFFTGYWIYLLNDFWLLTNIYLNMILSKISGQSHGRSTSSMCFFIFKIWRKNEILWYEEK